MRTPQAILVASVVMLAPLPVGGYEAWLLPLALGLTGLALLFELCRPVSGAVGTSGGPWLVFWLAVAGYGAALKAAVDAGEMPADVAANATLQAIQKLWKSKAGTAISAMAEQADARSSEREQALRELKQIRLDHDRITKRMEEIDAGWYLRRDKIVAYQRVKAAQADRSNGISNALSAIRVRASVIKDGLRRLEKQCETTPGADPCRTLDVRRKQANAELEQLQDGQSLLSRATSF